MSGGHRFLGLALGIALFLAALASCRVIGRRVLGLGPAATKPTAAPTRTGEGAIAEPTADVMTPAGPGILPPTPTAFPLSTEGPVPAKMTWAELTDATSRETVCNDGSPAGYYIRRGTGAGSRLWLIHLQGGGLCVGNSECDQRQLDLPQFMTSRSLPPSREGNGIMSTSPDMNADFFRANHVFVPYCSSDLWSGDREASGATGNRHFRGARIVRAVIEALMDPSITASPNLSEAEQVLFSGSSAGGFGVLVHLDWLAQTLPRARVRGMNDAGWAVDIEPFDPSIEPVLTQFQDGYAFWNATVDASCAAANPGAEGRCYVGEYVYPYLETSLFVQISQRDGPQLNALGITRPVNEQERQYGERFGAAVRASLEEVEAAFSPASVSHGILENPEFWTMQVDDLTLSEVISNWFFASPAQPVKAIE